MYSGRPPKIRANMFFVHIRPSVVLMQAHPLPNARAALRAALKTRLSYYRG
jgi:hypothetical protein